MNALKKLKRNLWCSTFRRQESGSVLILVVWVIAFLSFLAVGFGASGMTSLSLTRRLHDELKSSYAAAAGVQFAMGVLGSDLSPRLDSTIEDWASSPLIFRNHRAGEGAFTVYYDRPNEISLTPDTVYGLEDEESKINVNTVDDEILRQLFMNVGLLEFFEARELADVLMDWRDEDTDKREYGAEKYDYMGLPDSRYTVKDAPFQSVEELLLLKGMPLEVYDRIMPYVTVTSNGKINMNTTSEKVLLGLGLRDVFVDNILRFRRGDDGKERTGDDRIFPTDQAILLELEALGSLQDIGILAKLIEADMLTVDSETFRFMSEGTGESGREKVSVETVIDVNGNILAWRET